MAPTRSPITCHGTFLLRMDVSYLESYPNFVVLVLDASLGRPASGVAVRLEQYQEGGSGFTALANGCARHFVHSPLYAERTHICRVTDSDGRCSTLLDPSLRPSLGIYKMVFETGPYFAISNTQTFYPFVEVSLGTNA